MLVKIFPASFGTSNFKFSEQDNQNLQSGFTLFELLVFLLIVVALTTSLLAIVIDLFRSQKIGDNEEIMQNTFVALTNDITQEVQWSESAVHTDNAELDSFQLVKEDLSGATVTTNFSVDTGMFLKNDEALLPTGLRVTAFDVENVATSTLPLWRIRLQLEFTEGRPQTTEKIITVSMRK